VCVCVCVCVNVDSAGVQGARRSTLFTRYGDQDPSVAHDAKHTTIWFMGIMCGYAILAATGHIALGSSFHCFMFWFQRCLCGLASARAPVRGGVGLLSAPRRCPAIGGLDSHLTRLNLHSALLPTDNLK